MEIHELSDKKLAETVFGPPMFTRNGYKRPNSKLFFLAIKNSNLDKIKELALHDKKLVKDID